MEEESEVVSGEELPSLPNADDSESAFPAADPPVVCPWTAQVCLFSPMKQPMNCLLYPA